MVNVCSDFFSKPEQRPEIKDLYQTMRELKPHREPPPKSEEPGTPRKIQKLILLTRSRSWNHKLVGTLK
jgi:hypothetical protein